MSDIIKALLFMILIIYADSCLTKYQLHKFKKLYNQSCENINKKFEEQEQHIKALEEQLNNK